MANRRTWVVLLAAAIFGMNGHAQVPAHQGLTFNGDGVLRNSQIHWPKGFEPEQADLFAHNEIDIQARCEIAFSNLVDAEAWPCWYSKLEGRQGSEHSGSSAPEERTNLVGDLRIPHREPRVGV